MSMTSEYERRVVRTVSVILGLYAASEKNIVVSPYSIGDLDLVWESLKTWGVVAKKRIYFLVPNSKFAALSSKPFSEQLTTRYEAGVHFYYSTSEFSQKSSMDQTFKAGGIEYDQVFTGVAEDDRVYYGPLYGKYLEGKTIQFHGCSDSYKGFLSKGGIKLAVAVDDKLGYFTPSIVDSKMWYYAVIQGVVNRIDHMLNPRAYLSLIMGVIRIGAHTRSTITLDGSWESVGYGFGESLEHEQLGDQDQVLPIKKTTEVTTPLPMSTGPLISTLAQQVQVQPKVKEKEVEEPQEKVGGKGKQSAVWDKSSEEGRYLGDDEDGVAIYDMPIIVTINGKKKSAIRRVKATSLDPDVQAFIESMEERSDDDEATQKMEEAAGLFL